MTAGEILIKIIIAKTDNYGKGKEYRTLTVFIENGETNVKY